MDTSVDGKGTDLQGRIDVDGCGRRGSIS